MGQKVSHHGEKTIMLHRVVIFKFLGTIETKIHRTWVRFQSPPPDFAGDSYRIVLILIYFNDLISLG